MHLLQPGRRMIRYLRSKKDISFDAELLTVLRLVFYTLFIVVITGLLPAIVQSGDVSAFNEGGWIEWCQLLLLMATSGIYFSGRGEDTHFQQIFHFLGCLSAFAAVRELDSFFDRLIPLVGWKFGYLILIYALLSACRHKKILYLQILQFLKTHSAVVLWAGFLFVVPVGQLIGHGAFLRSLMGDDYLHDYKRVLEEALELIGYIIILAGSMEAAIELRKTGQTRTNKDRSCE